MVQLISFIFSFILLSILNFSLNKKSQEVNLEIRNQHYFFGYLFMLYLMISLVEVVGFPTFNQLQRISNLNQSLFNLELNFIPFKNGIEISSILNIIFFMPFGFLLPTLWNKFRSLLPTALNGILFSLIIEASQMFVPYRATDINDLIMNTLGTICGWLLFKGMSNIFNNLSNKTIFNNSSNDLLLIKLEPYLYILIAIISTFFGFGV